MSGIDPQEIRRAVLGLAGAMTAASDQAESMTDEELGQLLLSGRWTTIEIREAGRRLVARAAKSAPAEDGESNRSEKRPSESP